MTGGVTLLVQSLVFGNLRDVMATKTVMTEVMNKIVVQQCIIPLYIPFT